ncbi:alpha/beta hydrolase [Mesorhizobium sp. SB112]|uniref:alpha/beta hydrolase n=1 Tax=Mesorhizobium sp. SB112 TaxID=3151853 RepID=UPI0032646C6F
MLEINVCDLKLSAGLAMVHDLKQDCPMPETKDWNDAFTNGAYIADGSAYPAKWSVLAAEFREKAASANRLRANISYGPHERNRYDLYLPEGLPKGLAIIVHGGYWLAFDKSYWSHLAAGPLAHGFTVAMPSYVLSPEAKISGITTQIGAAITAAAGEIDGPIHTIGHSAGGQMVTRMVSRSSPLSNNVLARIKKTVSLSGLHDLRPLMKTSMNEKFGLDIEAARSESPALLEPVDGIDVTCWVGADERPEFLRQNALLANAWSGFDIAISSVEEEGRHHYDIIDGLMDPEHRLVKTLLAL